MFIKIEENVPSIPVALTILHGMCVCALQTNPRATVDRLDREHQRDAHTP